MTPQTALRDKLSSKKFIFSIFSLIVVSSLLFLDKLPPSYYEGIAIAIIITYLSSNVAYRYVNNKAEAQIGDYKKQEDEYIEEQVKEHEYIEEGDKAERRPRKQAGVSYGE